MAGGSGSGSGSVRWAAQQRPQTAGVAAGEGYALHAVQRSAGSASVLLGGRRAAERAVRRSPSMHERMRALVLSAKAAGCGTSANANCSATGGSARVGPPAPVARHKRRGSQQQQQEQQPRQQHPHYQHAPVATSFANTRTAGQVVGDLGLAGPPKPSAATVRARSRRVAVVLVRRQDAAALRTAPTLKVSS